MIVATRKWISFFMILGIIGSMPDCTNAYRLVLGNEIVSIRSFSWTCSEVWMGSRYIRHSTDVTWWISFGWCRPCPFHCPGWRVTKWFVWWSCILYIVCCWLEWMGVKREGKLSNVTNRNTMKCEKGSYHILSYLQLDIIIRRTWHRVHFVGVVVVVV